MANILIAFYSRNGTVESLAKAIAEGAQEVGSTVRLRRAREFVSPEAMAKAPGWTESAAQIGRAHV
jgi:NAD(P)H dehydrogenase (quinone)